MIYHKDLNSKFEQGFTLVEIMVILIVICVLAVMAIPQFSVRKKSMIAVPQHTIAEKERMVMPQPDIHEKAATVMQDFAIRKEEARVRTISARDYLFTDEKETEGYGLYSYVVLPERPSNERMRQRFVKLYEAFFSTLEPTETYLMMGVDKKNLNETCWMLRLKEKVARQDITIKNKTKEWLFFVDNYDYARARIILNRIKDLNGEGPFIVCYVAPLASGGELSLVERDKVLVFDFSNKHEELFTDVFKKFQERVACRSEMWKGKFLLDEIRLVFYSLLKENADKMIYLAEVIKKIQPASS